MKQTENDSSNCALDSLTPSISSDSGAWLPTPQFDYKPKLFEDPRNSHSDKENIPPLESAPMPILNIEENDFLDRTEKSFGERQLMGSQQEPETEDDMGIRDFSERPANDKRPP